MLMVLLAVFPTTGLLDKFNDDADFFNLLFATVLFTNAFASDDDDNDLVDMLRPVSDLSLSIRLFFPTVAACEMIKIEEKIINTTAKTIYL